METVRKLIEKEDKVYVLLQDEEICRIFMQNAENEGFVFGDGKKPSEKHCSDIIAVNSDMTLSYVNITGRLAIGAGKAKPVDYREYISPVH